MLAWGLTVVDFSVALHHVFNAPEDKIIWDVGHRVSRIKVVALVVVGIQTKLIDTLIGSWALTMSLDNNRHTLTRY